jgi:hypothetical protein
VQEKIDFYMDEHVHPAVTAGLRRRGVNVLTAQEAGLLNTPDEAHLLMAAELGRVIFTQDVDFLRLHSSGMRHSGIVYAHQRTPIGSIVRGLMLVYQVLDLDDMQDHLEFL